MIFTKKQYAEIYNLLKSTSISSDMPPLRIRAIRKKYNLSGTKFASLLMINYETYRSWEQSRRIPSTPGYAILIIAEKYPDIFLQNSKEIIAKIKSESFGTF